MPFFTRGLSFGFQSVVSLSANLAKTNAVQHNSCKIKPIFAKFNCMTIIEDVVCDAVELHYTERCFC